jgi:biotin carboxylase
MVESSELGTTEICVNERLGVFHMTVEVTFGIGVRIT